MREKKFLIISKVYSNVLPLYNSTPEPTFNPTAFYTPKQTKTRTKVSKQEISPFKLNADFVNEIRNDEENTNSENIENILGIRIYHSWQKKLN